MATNATCALIPLLAKYQWAKKEDFTLKFISAPDPAKPDHVQPVQTDDDEDE